MLLPNERVIAQIPIVAVKGLVTHATDMKVGKGSIICTAMTLETGDKVHRLHFAIGDHKSSFSASESYVTADVNNPTVANRQGNQTIKAMHELTGTYASAFVENNLVHIHSEVEEVSKYVHEINGMFEFNPEKSPCCPCLNACCNVLCIGKCHRICHLILSPLEF